MAAKNIIKVGRTKDANGHPHNGPEVEKTKAQTGDTIQFSNGRRAQALVIFSEGTVGLAVKAPPQPGSSLTAVGDAMVLTVPPSTPPGGGGGRDNPGISSELTVTELVAGKFCSRHFEIVYVNDYNPVDAGFGASGGGGQDPEIIIVP